MLYFVIWVVFNNSGDIILVNVVSQLQLGKFVSEIKGGQIAVAPQDLLCVID